MKKIKTLFLAACAVVAMTAVSCSSQSKDKTQTSDENVEAVDQKGVITLTDDTKFRPNMDVKEAVVLDFNATWCIPCKKLTPAFDKAAEVYEGKVKFYSVDIDNNTQTAHAFDITGVPTVIIMTPDGKMSKYVGLGDFATEAELSNPDLTDAQLTDIIFKNMCQLIDGQISK